MTHMSVRKAQKGNTDPTDRGTNLTVDPVGSRSAFLLRLGRLVRLEGFEPPTLGSVGR